MTSGLRKRRRVNIIPTEQLDAISWQKFLPIRLLLKRDLFELSRGLSWRECSHRPRHLASTQLCICLHWLSHQRTCVGSNCAVQCQSSIFHHGYQQRPLRKDMMIFFVKSFDALFFHLSYPSPLPSGVSSKVLSHSPDQDRQGKCVNSCARLIPKGWALGARSRLVRELPSTNTLAALPCSVPSWPLSSSFCLTGIWSSSCCRWFSALPA